MDVVAEGLKRGNINDTGLVAQIAGKTLAEQAVEKYLKAYWMNAKKEASPFTHSLTELGDALGVPRALRKHLVSLTADYTTARYPDAANGVPYDDYDRETAEAKVASAEAVLKWLRERTND